MFCLDGGPVFCDMFVLCPDRPLGLDKLVLSREGPGVLFDSVVF